MEANSVLATLGAALVVAAIGAFVAMCFRQSVVLGYILAGVAIGPFTPGFVGDVHAVESLAEVGVVLLMFAVGVDFSLRHITHAGKVILFGAPLQVILVAAVGAGVGILIGWSGTESIFYGAAVAISSSIVLIKVLAERGDLSSIQGRTSVAWTAMQDVVTVILVVLLDALARGGSVSILDVGLAILKAAVFIALLMSLGSRLLPLLFSRVAASSSREVFAVTVAAVAIGMAESAQFFGVSLALGAFIAGVVVSESDVSHRILGEIGPLRDIFSAIFFVSVGMLLNPGFVATHIPEVAITFVMIVVVKGAVFVGIALVFKVPPRAALLVGAAMAQAAEFSLIMIQIGTDLDAVSDDVFNTVLGAAVFSVLVTPVLYATADRVGRWWERRLPPSPLATHEDIDETLVRRHTIVCGYGRVGRLVTDALTKRGMTVVVIDEDQNLIKQERTKGMYALAGSAELPVLLDAAGVERAHLLVIAIPDTRSTRLIVDYARQINPRISIVARTHTVEEQQHLLAKGVQEAIVGEVELGIELTRYALRRYGVSANEAMSIAQRIRSTTVEV